MEKVSLEGDLRKHENSHKYEDMNLAVRLEKHI